MHRRVLQAAASVLWAVVAPAIPTSYNGQPNRVRSNVTNGDPTLTDPLWLRHGLNASQEYKYFHEPGRDDVFGHYDVRFFTTPVDDTERAETLTHMIRAYLNFFEENRLETWLAHGTLLGWWWNGKVGMMYILT